MGSIYTFNPHFSKQDRDILEFDLHICVVTFDAEQVYAKLQITNFKNKEVTSNPKPQTLEKTGLSKTLNTKFTLNPEPFP